MRIITALFIFALVIFTGTTSGEEEKLDKIQIMKDLTSEGHLNLILNSNQNLQYCFKSMREDLFEVMKANAHYCIQNILKDKPMMISNSEAHKIAEAFTFCTIAYYVIDNMERFSIDGLTKEKKELCLVLKNNAELVRKAWFEKD